MFKLLTNLQRQFFAWIATMNMFQKIVVVPIVVTFYLIAILVALWFIAILIGFLL